MSSAPIYISGTPLGRRLSNQTKLPGLGIILPDDGPFDYEWLRLDGWLSDHGLGHIRLLVERSEADGILTVENLRRCGALEVLLPPARRLADAGADVIVWACTCGSFIGGYDYAHQQARAIATETGLPTTSTSLAIIAAAKHLGAQEVDLLSTYSSAITEILVTLLHDAGLHAPEVRSLGALYTSEAVALDVAHEFTEFVRHTPKRSNPIIIPDTACNTLDLVDGFEAEAGRPVITANAASLWYGLTLMGEDPRGTGVGLLFHRESAQ